MREILVTEFGRIRDGGTVTYVSELGLKFFVDNRIGTKTKGAVYDRYPGDEGAKILDVKLIPVPKELSINAL